MRACTRGTRVSFGLTLRPAARSDGLRGARAAAADADAAAWALRRAFDAVLALPDGAAAAAPTELLSFREGLPPGGWAPIHDTVMGGASSGTLRYDATRRAALFAGDISTAGSGGFASVRSAPCCWRGDAAGVLLEAAAADGQQRSYKLTARVDDAFDGVGYQAIVVLGPGDEAATHRVPFSAFEATFRGRALPDAPPLRAGALRCLGVMLSRFEGGGRTVPGFVLGPFALAIYTLGVYA